MDEHEESAFEEVKDFDDFDYEAELERMYPDEDQRNEFVTEGL
jgi:hypothetical protein